jgi:Uma2 family endonuclease
MTTADYLGGRETVARRELTGGILREPPSPFYGHQQSVVRGTVLLDAHVREQDIGVVCVAPMDVVLDAERALIVQPDVMVILKDRRQIIRQQIWGAPNLVVEVASATSRRYDITLKRRWYREYGVDEYWVIDPEAQSVRVIRYPGTRVRARVFRRDALVVSDVLPAFHTPASAFFE